MPGLYSASDVFVLPSQGPGETWGLSVNEAMANEKAIIVSNKCGCAVDLVEDGINGYIFESANVSDLKIKMQAIFKSRETLNEMKEKSREKINFFSLENLASVIEKKIIEIF
jgi:glycosyltransferase involved in cell wall biosynthesis